MRVPSVGCTGNLTANRRAHTWVTCGRIAVPDEMNREKLMRMAGAVRTGGKGTVRRKKKAVHKTTSTDDKRLQNTLKRLGVNTIPGIEEVNIFLENDLINFTNPKVQASIAANTYVVSGPAQTKKISEMMPGIMNQLGPDSMKDLKRMMGSEGARGKLRTMKMTGGGGFGVPGAAAGGGALGGIQEMDEEDDDDDDDVPDLVENTNFEDASKE